MANTTTNDTKSGAGTSPTSATASTSAGASVGSTAGAANGASVGASKGESARPSKLNDALKILDEALAGDGANLKEMLGQQYGNIRTAITEMAPKVSESLRRVSSDTVDRVRDLSGNGMQRGRELVDNVDSQVRSNPWMVIGGVAVGSLVLGYLFGRSTSAAPSESGSFQSETGQAL